MYWKRTIVKLYVYNLLTDFNGLSYLSVYKNSMTIYIKLLFIPRNRNIAWHNFRIIKISPEVPQMQGNAAFNEVNSKTLLIHLFSSTELWHAGTYLYCMKMR